MSSVGDDPESELLADASNIQSSPTSDSESGAGDYLDAKPIIPASDVESQHEGSELDKEDEDFGSDQTDRENRFEGPVSTWRFFTEDERSLATSLDQQQANDLSLHLYNAHALQARVRIRDPEALSRVKAHRSKKHWIELNENGSSPWHPDAAWTAWPLKPEDVPRKREQFGLPFPSVDNDDVTYKRNDAWNPATDLEEEVKALILKSAKDQFRERQSAQTSNTAELDLLVDEDETDALLDPMVRRILSKFDELLQGLHKNRHGQVGAPSRSRSGPPPSNQNELEHNQSPPVYSRSPKKRKSSAVSDGAASGSGNALTDDDCQPDEQPKKKTKRRRPLDPRDWSEVLGVASFVGWDPGVLKRAASRCAALFGEGMSLSTTIQAADGNGSNVETELLRERNVRTKSKAVVHLCPILECERHFEPYEKAWRWREHLKRSHKYSKQEIEEAEAKLRATDETASG